MSDIRNRIKRHCKVRAGDLLTHEWNFRTHPGRQKAALAGIYQEVGFAHSLLAYELPDGRLKLIDGHLRRNIDPDMEVDVEVLDVNDEEAASSSSPSTPSPPWPSSRKSCGNACWKSPRSNPRSCNPPCKPPWTTC